MIEKNVTVNNRMGLHARPSAMVVQTASKFESEIHLTKGSMTVNVKSMLGVMALAAEYGTELLLRVEGPDEKEASKAIIRLFKTNFREAY
jgi:phosphocarrier protein